MKIAGRSAIVLGLSTLMLSLGAPTPASAYVAIWYDEATGIFGKTFGSERDRDSADVTAGINCLQKGGSSACREVVYSKSGCVAFAMNGKRWGSGSASTLERAQQKALERAGGGVVLVQTCDFWPPQ